MTPALTAFVATVGGPIGREHARQIARRELEKPVYHENDPNLVHVIIQKIIDWLLSIGATTARHLPGGWPAVVAVIVVLLLLVLAIRLGVGPLQRSHARSAPLTVGQPLSASEHRELAESHAADGDFAAAVLEWMRAIAAELDERGVLPASPGRTADELAAESAEMLPGYADDLRAAARTFDDVWYGGHAGAAADERRLRELDGAIRRVLRRPRAADMAGTTR